MDQHSAQTPDAEQWLRLTEMAGIVPLVPEMGAMTPKAVPDSLLEPMFGGPDPDALTYAIVDPHRFGDMGALDDHPADRRRSLYTGTEVTEFSEAAPSLLRLNRADPLTAKFFTDVPGFPPDANLHFWARNSAVFLRSPHDFETVFRHLRHFTRLRDTHGTWFVRRFWDAEHLQDWLGVIATDLTVAARFFGHLQDREGPIIKSFLVPSAAEQSCLHVECAAEGVNPADLPVSRSQPMDDGYRDGLRRTAQATSVRKIARVLAGSTFDGRAVSRASVPARRALAQRCVTMAPALGVQSELGWARLTSIAAVLGADFLNDPRFADRRLSFRDIRQDSQGEQVFCLGQGCIETMDQICATSFTLDHNPPVVPDAQPVTLKPTDVTAILARIDRNGEWHWGAVALATWAQRFIQRFGDRFETPRRAHLAIALAYVHGLGVLDDPIHPFRQALANSGAMTLDAAAYDLIFSHLLLTTKSLE